MVIMTDDKDADDPKIYNNETTSEVEPSQETEADYYALKKWELGFLRVCIEAFKCKTIKINNDWSFSGTARMCQSGTWGVLQ